LSAAMTEQDTVDEIADCIEALVLTRPGERMELPQYGLDDPTFVGLNKDDLMTAIERWETRATVAVEEGWDFDEFIQKIRLEVREARG
jgi:phage baseplate assembly protein W